MKKFLSARYSQWAFNIASFLLRVSLGFLMCLNHGIPKLANFSALKTKFYDPFHKMGAGNPSIASRRGWEECDLPFGF